MKRYTRRCCFANRWLSRHANQVLPGLLLLQALVMSWWLSVYPPASRAVVCPYPCARHRSQASGAPVRCPVRGGEVFRAKPVGQDERDHRRGAEATPQEFALEGAGIQPQIQDCEQYKRVRRHRAGTNVTPARLVLASPRFASRVSLNLRCEHDRRGNRNPCVFFMGCMRVATRTGSLKNVPIVLSLVRAGGVQSATLECRQQFR